MSSPISYSAGDSIYPASGLRHAKCLNFERITNSNISRVQNMTYFFNCSQNNTRPKWHRYKWLNLNLPRASSVSPTVRIWLWSLINNPSGEKLMPQYLRDQSFWKDEIGTARLPQTLISLPIHDKELSTEKHFVSNFSTAVLNFCNSQRLYELSTLKILDILIFLGFSSFLAMYLSALLTEKIPVYLVSKFEIAIDCEVW